jgi:predicted CoA-binding protein
MENCEMPQKNATNAEIEAILKQSKSVAVVGLSDKPDRDSFRVAQYLQLQGYKIIPVNPQLKEVLGEKSYASLKEIGTPVDIVDIFRKPDAIPAIVDEAIAIGAKTVWMQEGLAHNASANKARNAGLNVVMNKCLLKEHRHLFARSQ